MASISILSIWLICEIYGKFPNTSLFSKKFTNIWIPSSVVTSIRDSALTHIPIFSMSKAVSWKMTIPFHNGLSGIKLQNSITKGAKGTFIKSLIRDPDDLSKILSMPYQLKCASEF